MLIKFWRWVALIVTAIFIFVLMIGHVSANVNYTNDEKGIYPTQSWQPTGQTNVINHQGGYGSKNDGNTSWNGDSSNVTNSYLKFGTNEKSPDYAIRKYAKETSTPGLYDVYLNVRGSTQQDIKPIDIVLVVDMSGSMEEGTGRAQAVRTGIRDFMSSINQAGLGNYVKVGLVGYSSTGYSTNSVNTGLANVSDNAHQNTINNQLNQKFNGGTYTQDGIRRGAAMLNADNSGNKKMMILLTDGVPTLSQRVAAATTINGTVYATAFSNRMDEPNNTSRLSRRYNVTSQGKRITINDTWPATLGQAKMAKDSGAEIHTLGIQLTGDKNYLTQNEVRSLIAQTASGNNNYQDANSAQDIVNYLKSQSDNIVNNFNNVVNGSISDPLGDQFIYDNASSVDVKSVGSTRIDDGHIPQARINGNQVQVSKITLGDNQEIQVHYRAHINTETANFKTNYWYQLNGKTTFTPKEDDPNDIVQFGVPSVKAPGTTLSIKKQWHTLEDVVIPDKIEFSVNRDNTTSSNGWTNATGELTKSENWQQLKLDHLLVNNEKVLLPKYNNAGQDFNYQVKSETTVPGFITTIDGKDNNYTITNTNLGVTVKKFVEGSQTPLAGANFKLIKYTNNWAGVDASFGAIDFNGTDTTKTLAPGSYELVEDKAPQGYQRNTTPIRFRLTEAGKFYSVDGHEITATSLPSENGLYIAQTKNGIPVLTVAQYDKLKQFDLFVNKVDASSGKKLPNATFKLTGENGLNVTETSDDNGKLSFSNLKPGNYTLEESKAPSGYQLLSEKLSVKIDTQGKVSFSDVNVPNSVTLSQEDNKNNQITVTIKNSEAGVLPKTGGSGIISYILIGVMLLMGAATLGICSIYRTDEEM